MAKPDFDIALDYWGKLLKERDFSPNMVWVFRENLFHVKDGVTSDIKLIFETKINPVTLDDVRLVYNQAKTHRGPIVFEMLVETHDFALCTLLGDTLTTSDDIFIDEWDLYFFAKDFYLSFEEVRDLAAWMAAKAREWKHISELDYVFCLNAFKPNTSRVP